jgi:hypothetical protein
VTVEVPAGLPKAKVTLYLQFVYPMVFIVGEGPKFPYAIGLAKRYSLGEPAALRTLPKQEDADAPDTPVSQLRKWVVVSQYDVFDAPTTDLPRTLYFYEDPDNDRSPKNNRDGWEKPKCFNVRIKKCWEDLLKKFQPFDAIIFNNPHPGYGLHRCNVFGLWNGQKRPAGRGRGCRRRRRDRV